MMYKTTYSLIGCCLCVLVAMAQPKEEVMKHSPYVLDTFTKGKVILKAGNTSEETLNYNALTGEMIFDAGGKYLAIDNPAGVDTVIIETRRFIPVNNKFYELVPGTTDPLFMEYVYTVKDPGTEIGYGMTSATMAAQGLTALIKTGGAYKLKLPDGYQLTTGLGWWIWKDGSYQKAGNVQQLSKIYPGKKQQINKLARQSNTTFSNRDEMVALVQQVSQQ